MKLSRATTYAVLLPVLWLAALGSAAGSVWVKHRTRGMFMQLQQLAQQRDDLDIEWGQLQLEQSAWSQQGFVENVAGNRLHMATPAAQEIKIVAP